MPKMQEQFSVFCPITTRSCLCWPIGCHRVCSNRMMRPVRRACCNQWLRAGNYQSHVEQISPLFINKREHELSVHNRRIYRVSRTRGLCDPWLTRPETQPYMRFLGDAQSPSARTFALRLPPHRPSRDCTCLKLVVVISRRLYRQSDVGSPTGDFHPISSCPCRAYQKIPADACGAAEFGVRRG